MSSKVIEVLKHPLAWAAIGVIALIGLVNTGPAKASTLEEVLANSHRLFTQGNKICSVQSVKYEGQVFWLTAQHCVEKRTNHSVYIPELNEELETIKETQYFLDPIYEGKYPVNGDDVAILDDRVDEEFSGIDVATQEQIDAIKVGDTVTVVGYPSSGWSDDLYISTGQFLGYTLAPLPEKVEGIWFKTSADVDGGSSGGAVYLEKDGEYFFISTTSQMDKATVAPMSYFTDPVTVRAALDKALKHDPEKEETMNKISDFLSKLEEIL